MSSTMESLTRQIYASAVIVAVSVGIYVVISGLSLYLAFHADAPSGSRWGRRPSVTVIYILVMLVVTLVWFVAIMCSLADALVESASANGAGHTNGQVFFSLHYHLENVLLSIQYLSSDALMVYRTYILYGQNKKVIIFPLAVFTGFFAVVIMFQLLPLSTAYQGPLHLPSQKSVCIAFYSLSAGLNVITTGLIATKLIRSDFSASYISIIVLMVESAVVYTTFSVAFVSVDTTSSSASKTWFGALTTCTVFLNQSWIILRVTMARPTYRSRSTIRSRTADQDTVDLPVRLNQASKVWAVSSPEIRKYPSPTEVMYTQTVSKVTDV